MEMKSFFIEYRYKSKTEFAEVKTCCQEENTIYYDISIQNQYQFTVTPVANEKNGLVWKISLKNADRQVDPQLIKIIGNEIEKYIFSNSLTI